jgi:Mg2+ and Co2+ transporter CorA
MISTFSNLEDVLSEIVRDQDRQDRVVWTVRLNGENYSEATPHDARKIRVEDIQSLEINTMGKTEISQEFLQNGGKMLEILNQSAKEISGLFRKADEKEANKRYLEFIESYQDLFQMLRHTRDAMNLDFGDIMIHGASVNDKLEALQRLFDQMIHAQEGRDWVMLADLLEYELASLLKEWEEILPVLEGKSVTVH